MEINIRYIIGAAIVVIIVIFAAGYFSRPTTETVLSDISGKYDGKIDGKFSGEYLRMGNYALINGTFFGKITERNGSQSEVSIYLYGNFSGEIYGSYTTSGNRTIYSDGIIRGILSGKINGKKKSLVSVGFKIPDIYVLFAGFVILVLLAHFIGLFDYFLRPKEHMVTPYHEIIEELQSYLMNELGVYAYSIKDTYWYPFRDPQRVFFLVQEDSTQNSTLQRTKYLRVEYYKKRFRLWENDISIVEWEKTKTKLDELNKFTMILESKLLPAEETAKEMVKYANKGD